MSAHGSLPRVRPPAADSNLRACASHHRLSLPWPSPPPRLGRPHRVRHRRAHRRRVRRVRRLRVHRRRVHRLCGPVLVTLVRLAVILVFVFARRSPSPVVREASEGRGWAGAHSRARRLAGRGTGFACACPVAWTAVAWALSHGPQSHGRCRMGRCRMGRCRVRRSRAICRAPPDAHARMKSAEYPPHAPLGSAHWDLGSRVARPVYTCIIHPGIHLPGVYQRCILWYTR